MQYLATLREHDREATRRRRLLLRRLRRLSRPWPPLRLLPLLLGRPRHTLHLLKHHLLTRRTRTTYKEVSERQPDTDARDRAVTLAGSPCSHHSSDSGGGRVLTHQVLQLSFQRSEDLHHSFVLLRPRVAHGRFHLESTWQHAAVHQIGACGVSVLSLCCHDTGVRRRHEANGSRRRVCAPASVQGRSALRRRCRSSPLGTAAERSQPRRGSLGAA